MVDLRQRGTREMEGMVATGGSHPSVLEVCVVPGASVTVSTVPFGKTCSTVKCVLPFWLPDARGLHPAVPSSSPL